MEIDASELRQVMDDWSGIPPRVQRDLRSVGRKAAQNVKDAWNDAASGSRHFNIVASYDEEVTGGRYEAEVGPARRWRSNRLAGIYHFGGANGGGGSGGDPQRFADDELPGMERAMSELLDRVLP